MDVKWLEDFITLANTKSFSRAAGLRCVTQPAFSRRIQALEGWLGCELIDRSVYPTRLSPQGDVFYEQALLMLEQLRQARVVVRGGRPQNAHQVRVIVPHTLACSKMPSWVQTMREQLCEQVSDLSFQLAASNVHDAVIHFTDGGCDFLACFHHHREPIELDASKFEYKVLGTEAFLPFCAKDSAGKPKFNISSEQSIPLLSYSKHAYLWRMVDIALSSGPPLNLQPIFETDMSDSLRAMCEQGLGVAWLPHSMGSLSSRLVPLSGIYHTQMEIRLYRRIFKGKELGANPDYLEQVWNVWPMN